MQYKIRKSVPKKPRIIKLSKTTFDEDLSSAISRLKESANLAGNLITTLETQNLDQSVIQTIKSNVGASKRMLVYLSDASRTATSDLGADDILKTLIEEQVSRKVTKLYEDGISYEVLGLNADHGDLEKALSEDIMDRADSFFTKAVKAVLMEKIKEELNTIVLEMVMKAQGGQVETIRKQLQDHDDEEENEAEDD